MKINKQKSCKPIQMSVCFYVRHDVNKSPVLVPSLKSRLPSKVGPL